MDGPSVTGKRASQTVQKFAAASNIFWLKRVFDVAFHECLFVEGDEQFCWLLT
jgi:hypothetical protein